MILCRPYSVTTVVGSHAMSILPAFLSISLNILVATISSMFPEPCVERQSDCDQDVSYMVDHSQSLNLRENNAWKFFTFHNKTWYPLSYWPFSTLLSLAFIIPGTLFANEHGFIDIERRWKGMRRLAERNIIWRNIVIFSGDSMCVNRERVYLIKIYSFIEQYAF